MKRQILLVSICAILIAACGGADATATPTLSNEQIQTAAVETFSAALTQTALASPSETPVPTLTASPAPSLQPFPTATGGNAGGIPPAQPTAAGTASCYRLAFVSDVSIPDNTTMTPGQTFTKTWKVQNTGSCAWDAGFKFAFVGGEAMSGATFTLPSAVAPNATLDVSVAMTAPTKTGTLRGNWRMQTAAGQFFGDEVYVQIVVGGTASTTTITVTATGSAPTSTTTSTATATATATSTPTTP